MSAVCAQQSLGHRANLENEGFNKQSLADNIKALADLVEKE